MPTKWKSCCFALGAVVLVTGCEVAPQMELVSSNLYVSDRKPVAAAIVVPPASRRFSTAHDLPSGCLGTITFQPAPYGENFEQTVRDRFSRIFETVAVVPALATAEHSDIFFEATITDIGQRFACPISPEAFVDVKASLRALDTDGRELWRSATTSHRYNTGLLMYDPNREVGQNFSKAIAGIVDKVWVFPFGVHRILEASVRVSGNLAKTKHVGLAQQDVHLHRLAHVGRVAVGVGQLSGDLGGKDRQGEYRQRNGSDWGKRSSSAAGRHGKSPVGSGS